MKLLLDSLSAFYNKMIQTSKRKLTNQDPFKTKGKIVLVVIYLGLLAIVSRLFFWQIIKGDSLQKQAENQYKRSITLTGSRGSIFTSDGYALVTNNRVYTLFAQPYIIEENPQTISKTLLPYLLNELNDYKEATDSAIKEKIATNFEEQILE